jgi:hypothetical protein
MNQFENILETHKKCIQRCSTYVPLLGKRACDVRILPMYAAAMTRRLWLWSVKFDIRGWYTWSITHPP